MHPANRATPDVDTAPTLLQVFVSVLAGMFGVQSLRRHAIDFTHGRFWQFAVVGAVMTLAFTGMVIGLTRLAINLIA